MCKERDKKNIYNNVSDISETLSKIENRNMVMLITGL